MTDRIRSMHLVLIAAASSAFGGDFRAGLKGGVPATVYFKTGSTASRNGSSEYSAATRRYTGGLTAEWRTSGGFGLEFDVLYKRMGYVGIVTAFASGVLSASAFDVKGNSWEFPVLAKYRFGRRLQPFAAGGLAFRYVGPVRARGVRTEENLILRTSTIAQIDTTEPTDLRKRLYPGLTAAGGLEFGPWRVRLAPEFRYTHWTANIAGPGSVLRFNPHQAEFLLGLLF